MKKPLTINFVNGFQWEPIRGILAHRTEENTRRRV